MNQLVGSPVVIVRWPWDAQELGRLQTLGIPRLLVLAPDAEPPVDGDPTSDWIRMPAAEEDLEDLWARVRSLELRIANRRGAPELTGDGRMVFRDRWIAVSPTWERLLGVLISRFGEVASIDDLECAAWPDGQGTRELLRGQVAKLRRSVQALDLELVVVRDHGYVLQSAPSPTS